ncbi:MAG: hypothetical protein REI94_04740 [Moraxellaceae bacterium]|nr:hypothetical protein [Moraxellaceae bacterium]
MSEPLQALSTLQASDVAARFALSDDGKALLAAGDSVATASEKMAAAALWPEALGLVAYALPKLAAVSWARQSAMTLAEHNGPAQQAALTAVEQWMKTRDDTLRRQCFSAAEAAGLGSAAGCAALAAFWSEGSISPADAPAVPVPPHLCQHAAACSVQLAGVAQPELAASYYRQFIALATAIAEGKHPV